MVLSSIVAIAMFLIGGALDPAPLKHRAVVPQPHIDFFVATNGSDSYSGTLSAPNSGKTDGPFQSLDRARRAVASLRASRAYGGGFRNGAVSDDL